MAHAWNPRPLEAEAGVSLVGLGQLHSETASKSNSNFKWKWIKSLAGKEELLEIVKSMGRNQDKLELLNLTRDCQNSRLLQWFGVFIH